MINPIILIIAAALFLSALAVAVLNRPDFPVITSALIIILMFFVFSTFMLDSAITDLSSAENLNDFVKFLISSYEPGFGELEASFRTFMISDLVLFAASLSAMVFEALFILRKNSDV